MRFKLETPGIKKLDRHLAEKIFDFLSHDKSSTQLDLFLEGRAEPFSESSIAQLFEHICLQLQIVAGSEISTLFVREIIDSADLEIVVPFEVEALCLLAADVAAEMLTALEVSGSKKKKAKFDIEQTCENYLLQAQRIMLPIQDRALCRHARSHDIPVKQLAGRLLALGHGHLQQRLSATKTSHTNIIANDIAANKDYCRRVLEACGLPVPKYTRSHRMRATVAAAQEIGFPVVIKPNNGQMGRGVSIGVKSVKEAREAYRRAREFDRSVLIEEFVPGADFRMVVIDGQLVAASKRIPGHVVGDGKHNIQELVDEVNRDPRRGDGPRFSWTKIAIDDQANRLLAELGYDLNTVPKEGETVYLRRNANTSDGGTSVDVTDEVHPDNAAIAIRAAEAVGLDIAGVDVLTEDITRSMHEIGGAICEINSRPGLRKHLWPGEGKPRDVLTPIINMLFPNHSNGRIVTVLVTGTGNRNATARLLAQQLSDHGLHVGLVSGEGIEIDSAVIRRGNIDPHTASAMALLDSKVEAVVLAMSPGEIRRHGVSVDAANVSVVVDKRRRTRTKIRQQQTERMRHTEAALKVAAGIARDAVFCVSVTDERASALSSASLAPLHRLDSIADLCSKIDAMPNIFQQQKIWDQSDHHA